jgi:hypothetical protein
MIIKSFVDSISTVIIIYGTLGCYTIKTCSKIHMDEIPAI